VEGRKYFRAYTLKENAKQPSDLQISRNYANAVSNMGGTVIFDGECSGADCAENCGYRMMTGKVIKGGQQIIDQIVQMLKANPDLMISVEGHTDNAGNPKSNQTLSGERSKSVVAAIVTRGIDAKRLSAVGHGQDKPIADNSTDEGRAKNRRLELVKK
jgi:hypothetical protein